MHEVYQVYAMWWDSSVLHLISSDSASYIILAEYLHWNIVSRVSIVGPPLGRMASGGPANLPDCLNGWSVSEH